MVLLGKVTCFLADGDARIGTTAETLVDALSIPSASVQEAVARWLTPLFKYECLRAEVKRFVERLLKQLTEGADYAARHGAAVGLAGAIKGMPWRRWACCRTLLSRLTIRETMLFAI